jgi:hypothetical protein
MYSTSVYTAEGRPAFERNRPYVKHSTFLKNNMNYNNHYELLINRARIRKLEIYSEKHHIIPKCMGGTDNLINLVELTPEEHYLAHLLLVKIYPDNDKLIFAAHKMCQNSNGHRMNNKIYGWLRRRHSDAMSRIHKGRTASNKGIPHSGETKAKIAKSMEGRGLSEESRKKLSLSKTGHCHSEETKEKISKALSGGTRTTPTEETRRKISIAMKERFNKLKE